MIEDLEEGMRNVDLVARVTHKSKPRSVQSQYTNDVYTVCDATLEDDSGKVLLTLWNDDIDKVGVGDTVEIKNGYTTTFREVLQLHVGKYGTLTVV